MANQLQYLKLLHLAAQESETFVNDLLRYFLNQAIPLDYEAIETQVSSLQQPPPVTEVYIEPVDLVAYDHLLDYVDEVWN